MAENKNDLTSAVNRHYWLLGGLIAALMCSIMLRELERPIYGEHSWAEAHSSWLARVHLKHGLSYTKGVKTWAVGDPPTENPGRYLDHPHLATLLNAVGMRIFGWHDIYPALRRVQDAQKWNDERAKLQKGNDAALRKVNLVLALITLALLLKIMRHLVDEKTALLAASLYVMFPLTGYFGVGSWVTPTALGGFWCYLAAIGGLRAGPAPKPRHIIGLGLLLFLMVQISWSGFFYAMGIGVHYVARCIWRRQLPGMGLLCVLIAAPISSLALNFVIMAWGYGWDWQKIINLYTWRAGTGEKNVYTYLDWSKDIWRHALTNFTLPVLLAVGVGSAWRLAKKTLSLAGNRQSEPRSAHLWLFLLPGVFQLALLKGCLERHQTWEQPLSFLVALAGALGIAAAAELLGRVGKRIAVGTTVALLLIIAVAAARGLDHYHRPHFPPATVSMLQDLHLTIPPHQKLLTASNYRFMQHESKGAHYHPVFAWYLDREMVQTRSLSQINAYAKSGMYPRYLVQVPSRNQPYYRQMMAFIGELQKRYKSTQTPKPVVAARSRYAGPYVIFDLTQPQRQ